MKRNLLFTFASVLTLVVGFISCTNDEFDECFPVPATTRSVTEAADSTMTLEEVQARFQMLNEKYDVNLHVNKSAPLSCFNEKFFLSVENSLRVERGLDPIETTAISLLDYENDLDFLPVATTSARLAKETPNPGIDEPKDYDTEVTKELTLTTFGVHNKNDEPISPFIEHKMNIQYHFYFGKISRLKYLNLYDNTTINTTMLPDRYKDYYQSELEEILSQYPINYVMGTFYLKSLIYRRNNNPETADDYDFDYEFDITLGDNRLHIYANHISGITHFDVLD